MGLVELQLKQKVRYSIIIYIMHVLTEYIIFIEDIFFVTVTRAKFVAGPGALCSHPALIGTAFVKSNAFLK